MDRKVGQLIIIKDNAAYITIYLYMLPCLVNLNKWKELFTVLHFVYEAFSIISD